MRLLIIDPLFEGLPDIETEVLGSGIHIDLARTAVIDEGSLALADAVIACRSKRSIQAPLIDQMTRSRIIVQAGVGYNHIDLDACARRGIPVCNTPHYGTKEVADHTIALLLGLTRGISTYDARLKAGVDTWGTNKLSLPPIRRLSGLTFGIVGLGRIGTATALRVAAFQMNVAFYDPYVPAGQELALGVRRFRHLEDLYAQADVLSLHCPLTSGTQNLINAAAIEQLKPGAVLINTARGGIVDLSAVEHGLRTNLIAGVALDVLPHEPMDSSHPLLAAWQANESWLDGRLLITPHSAFYTPESLADMRRFSTSCALEFLKDGRLSNCVNTRELAHYGFEGKSQ